MSKVRIGFVGVGGMGQAAHLRNYVATPECEVVAIAELRPKLGQKVAARYGIAKVYPTHKELLANEQLDAIVAIQPFGMHVNLVPELLEKRVPVLTEKPLADTLENGEKLMAAVRKSKTPLYLAYHKRSDPASMYALRQVEAWKASGEVGKMKYVRVAMPPGDWVAQGMALNVHTDEGYAGGSWGTGDRYAIFANYYIHQVNLLRYFLGEDYQVIFAVPSSVLLVARSTSGVAATLEMATFQTTIDWQEEVFVGFEKGWVKVELPCPMVIDQPGKVTVFKDADKNAVPMTMTPSLPHFHAMRQQAVNFVKAVKGEKTPICKAEDGLKDLHVAKQYVDLVAESERKFGVVAAK